jgi:flavin-dependent dehydrogenase
LSNTFDVVVVGGGPAGAATAGALARRGRAVALLERTAYEESRVGETLGGEIGSLLGDLGAGDELRGWLDARVVPFRSVQAAWGSDVIEERSSLVHPFGDGVHVDRAAFDAKLCDWAESAGASVRRGMGTCTVETTTEGVRVVPAHGDPVTGRVFVDASGRGAPAGHPLATARRGRRWLACDQQIALVARARPRTGGPLGSELLLEAAPDGWWYTAPQPDASLVVAFVTDADLAPAGGRAARYERFTAALARTKHTSGRTEVGDVEALRVVRADSGGLLPPRGRAPTWWAVGDAAMAIDPLAGNGVARALRSGRDAAAAIDQALDAGALDGDESASREELEAGQRLSDYLDRRAEIYALEQRFPEAPFWMRRRPVDWKRAPITLSPEASLRAGSRTSLHDLAAVDALLPPSAIRGALASCTTPRPAHEVMSCLRDVAPLGDRRLLVALQELVARGAVVLG